MLSPSLGGLITTDDGDYELYFSSPAAVSIPQDKIIKSLTVYYTSTVDDVSFEYASSDLGGVFASGVYTADLDIDLDGLAGSTITFVVTINNGDVTDDYNIEITVTKTAAEQVQDAINEAFTVGAVDDLVTTNGVSIVKKGTGSFDIGFPANNGSFVMDGPIVFDFPYVITSLSATLGGTALGPTAVTYTNGTGTCTLTFNAITISNGSKPLVVILYYSGGSVTLTFNHQQNP